MRDILVEIWESVRRNKLRTTLTGLAVSWGIFMLIVLLSAGNGVMNTTMSNMSEMNTDAMRVYGGVTSKPYDGLEEGRRLDLTDKDVRLTGSKAFRDVIVDVCPTISTSSLTMTYGKKNFSVYTVGIYPIYTRINRTEILAGRSINDNDIAEARKVIVITHLQAKNMLMNSTDYEKIIGRRVKVGNLSYKIVGVRHGAQRATGWTTSSSPSRDWKPTRITRPSRPATAPPSTASTTRIPRTAARCGSATASPVTSR